MSSKGDVVGERLAGVACLASICGGASSRSRHAQGLSCELCGNRMGITGCV